ncbi:MAG: preprotein translocase subunit SecD [Burkholderiaceae bacterium]|nr:preprotein translocase subunit SecD [Burkholderiaceae bacterium]
MLLIFRTVSPAVIAAMLTLAGCQTATSTMTDHSGTISRADTVQPVALYVAHAHAGTGWDAVPVPDGTIYLESAPVLTRADLADATAMVDHLGKHFVGLRFTLRGAQKLATASGLNKGGMLALVIGRELVGAPRIDNTLDRGMLTFETPSAAVATDLAARIRGDASR